MKNIKILLILFCLPIMSFGQIKIKDLPTTDSGSVNDFILKDDSAGVSGSTKKISVADFISTYLPGSATSSGSSSPLFFAKAATTASLTVTYTTNTLTATTNGRFPLQDAVALTLGDYLLVKNQTNNKLQQGLYSLYDTGTVSTTAKLVRIDGYNETSEIYPSQISVTEGTVNAGRYYLQTTADPIVGTDEIVFVSTPAPSNPVYPVAFVDVFTVTDLPNSPAYTSGTNINNPGLNALYTATTNGAFPSLQGVTPQNGTKILVRAQTDSTKNGDYVFLNVGSASSKWKIKRINYTAPQLYPKLWEVSQGTSKGLVFQQNNKSIVTSTIGTSGNIYFTNITPSVIAGTGINVVNSANSYSITNSMPDQTVILNSGTGISTSGTYPTFTVTNSAPDQTVTIGSGTGISVTGTYPTFTVTNTSTDTNLGNTDLTSTGDRTFNGGGFDLSFSGIDELTHSSTTYANTSSQQDFTGTSHVINTTGFTRKGTADTYGTVNQTNQNASSVQLYKMQNSGNALYGTGTAEASALLELKDVTKAFLPNRWTTTERDAISSPVNGLFGYNVTTNVFNGYQGGAWVSIGSNMATANLTAAASYTATFTGFGWTLKGGDFTRVGQGNTSGTFNTRFQNSDLANLFTLKDDGAFALGIGASSGEYRAIAIGASAKAFNENDLAIGYEALKSQSANAGNWAVGYQACKAITTGTLNTFAGQSVAGTGTVMSRNAGFGYLVLSTGTGDDNAVFGYRGAYQATTATQVAAVGQDVAINVRAHSYSTYMGASSGPASTTAKNFQTCYGWATQADADGAISIGSGKISGSFYAKNSTANSMMVFFNATEPSFFVNANSNVVLNSGVIPVAGTHYEAAVTNAITMTNGTAPTTNIANSFQQYSTGGVPAFRTAAGNITTLDGIVSAAVAVVSTNKIKITVNGTDYYLLVTTVP